MLSPPHIRVALDAKESIGGEGEHMLVFRPVGPVAAGTVQGHVGIPWILDIFADGVCGVSLVLMTLGTDLRISLIAEQVGMIGPMGRMAGTAIALQDGFVFHHRLLLPGYDA